MRKGNGDTPTLSILIRNIFVIVCKPSPIALVLKSSNFTGHV